MNHFSDKGLIFIVLEFQNSFTDFLMYNFQEENRQEAASRRQLEIRTAMSNIDLLSELLDNVEANGASAEEMELCKEMASTCERLRPNLFRLAAETDDKEDSLGYFLLNFEFSLFKNNILSSYDNFQQFGSIQIIVSIMYVY